MNQWECGSQVVRVSYSGRQFVYHARWFVSYGKACLLVIALGPELQYFLKVKEDFSLGDKF